MSEGTYMSRCLELATKGELYVAPNPMVGCVIVHKGEIVADGYHEKYGGPHAEVNAFQKLDEGINPSECEVYVNLEPCAHFGKTPPCADLIVAKKPKRVIVGMLDPHKKVAGMGVKRILESGIDVKVGVMQDQCSAINKKFIKAHTYQLPYITLKWAETKNGFMARPVGSKLSKQISSEENKVFVHHLRATHQGILVGANTVNTDEPMLNVRAVNGQNPIKIVYSPTGSVNLSAKTFTTPESLVYTEGELLLQHGQSTKFDKLTLELMLKDLYDKGIHSVLVEGGAQLLATFLDEKFWDEAIVLKSDEEWEDGIKAPWIGIPSVREEIVNGDLIKYFKPR